MYMNKRKKIGSILVCTFGLLLSCVVIAMDQPLYTVSTVAIMGKEGNKKIIEVPLHIAQLSGTIKNLIDDMGGNVAVRGQVIPLERFSVAAIMFVFGTILPQYQADNPASLDKIRSIFESLLPERAIDVITLLDWLAVPNDLMATCTRALSKVMEKMPIAEIVLKDRLNSLSKNVMVDYTAQTINCLKAKIMSGAVTTELFDGSDDLVRCIKFSPDSRKVAFVTSRGEFDILTICSLDGSNKVEVNLSFPWGVTLMQFSPDSTKICVGSADYHDNLILCDVATGQIANLNAHDGGQINVIKFSSDGSKIISGSASNQHNIFVWDANSGQLDKEINGFAPINVADFTPDNAKVIMQSGQDSPILYGLETDEHIILDQPEGSIKTTLFGTKIVSFLRSKNNDYLILWDAIHGDKVALKGGEGVIYRVALSPDGSKVISAGRDSCIAWDTSTGRRIKILEGQEGLINFIAFNEDGSEFLCGSANALIICDSVVFEQIAKFNQENRMCAYSPDGNKVACVAMNFQITLLSLITEEQRRMLNEIKNYSPQQIILLYALWHKAQLEQHELEALRTFPPLIQKALLE